MKNKILIFFLVFLICLINFFYLFSTNSSFSVFNRKHVRKNESDVSCKYYFSSYLFRDTAAHRLHTCCLMKEEKKNVRNKGRTVTMRKKTLCDVYTKVMNKCYVARNHIVQRVYISLVHATDQYRKKNNI